MALFGTASNFNAIAVVCGIAMLFSGAVIAYLFQKYLFGKHQNKVPNAADKDGTESLE